jgi:hypothetical protein
LKLRKKIQPSAGQFGALKIFSALRRKIWSVKFFFGAPQSNLARRIFLRRAAAQFGAPKIFAELQKAFWHVVEKFGASQPGAGLFWGF